MATALADLIGLRDTVPLEPCGTDAEGHPIGLGRVGTVEPTTLSAFADRVAAALPAGPTGLLVGGDEAWPGAARSPSWVARGTVHWTRRAPPAPTCT